MKFEKTLIDPAWQEFLKPEFGKKYMQDLFSKLDHEYKNSTIFPPKNMIFEAFNRTPFDKIKVVILGQDPYHGENQAHGLCFSVNKGVKVPPSLVNIFKEIESDLNIPIPKSGDLSKWADQGVFLLNSLLTVESANPMAHKNLGWDQFTDKVIELINEKKSGVVFMLWGSPAHKKAKNVNESKHLVLKTVHPSPLSSYRGFFGSKHFSKCNDYLIAQKLSPIDWKLS